MKEFEKWFKEQMFSDQIKSHYETAWKAALGWVITKADSGFCQCGCIEDNIMNELNYTEDEKKYLCLWNKIPESQK